jgi:phosphocarrier protein HPr
MNVPGGVAAPVTTAATSAVITNHNGLHARPAVKLTKLAKRFDASVRMRIGAKGDWIDAKSVVKVMGMLR